MPRTDGHGWWTGVNNPANFAPLPAADIARYVQRGAHTYGREGWLVVGPFCQSDLLDRFRASYRVNERFAVGAYRVYFAVPDAGG